MTLAGPYSYGRFRVLKVLCAVALLAALVFSVQRHAASKKRPPHLASSQVAQHARALLATFGVTADVIFPPVLEQDQAGNTRSLLKAQRRWHVLCQSSDLRFDLLLNDANGRLCHLSADPSIPSGVWLGAPIAMAAQANEVAMHRLRDLQVVPPNAVLRLEEPPRHSHSREIWSLRYWVASPETSRPYRVFIQLDRRTGIPIAILDPWELNRYAGM
jgi:hypothetical protein